ncbi:fluoride efflux transporter FluC [Nocardioides daeguensis]|uniref:Fluoride-specific ion channel FluC n=1 Tax=Nocardioides daeguensis TaxID=908359 RepID=A0ABP6V7V0_9ACTN|nr:CrcB family protein [Nocardioides daeguensis]MBV6726255.1 CrcB family protein [Nocardioides daeguensis]MCR1772098.1 CrcB family protein [Nocardioides daeguensis]
MSALLVALGAAVGAPLRYALGHHFDGAWHRGTLTANTLASLVLGACVGWSVEGSTLALVGTGFCGGLSTYSSLAVQARDLGPRQGAAYALVTILLGLGACALGYVLAGG